MIIEDLHQRIRDQAPIIVELGCGPNKSPSVIGVDRLPLEGVDVVADLEQGLPFLPDNSVDEIHSRHVLEHVEAFEFLMREVYRVLKTSGRHVAIVPHFSNPYYYSDYTHKRFFGLYSFDYFARPEAQLRRKVPSFYVDFHFRVIERKLIFKSSFPFRNLFKQVFQRLFNITPYMQELYEEHLCYWLPCQEICFVMAPEKYRNDLG